MRKDISVLITLVVLMMVTVSAVATTSESQPIGLMQAVKQAQHAVEPAGEGIFTAFNYSNGQRFVFEKDGVKVMPPGQAPEWSLGLRLTGYGSAGSIEPVADAVRRTEGQRIEFERGAITEWYENRFIGLEQGFTLQQPPSDGADQVVIELAIEGGLEARWLEQGQAIAFHQADGSYALTYKDLVAFDAAERGLPAHLALVGDSLQIHVDIAGASWPVVVDPLVVNEQKVTAQVSDGESGDEFGWSVAVSGDTAIVGAWGDYYFSGGFNYNNVGSAYVFVRSDGVWTLQQKLRKPFEKGNDEYGRSVAIEGDTAVVGCHRCISGDLGAVYVYTRTAGVWTEQQQVTPEAAYQHHSDQFGIPVALSGDTLLVGDPNDDGWVDPIVYQGAGSAYVFTRSGGVWSQQAYFTVKNAGETPVAGEHFGTSVALEGDTALIGSPYHTHSGPRFGGSVYVYTRSGSTWTFQAEIYGSDTGSQDQFGTSVALSGTTALIGDEGEDYAGSGSSAVSNAGAAYVFTGSGASWTEQAKLVSTTRVEGDGFGASVALEGDMAVVGAWNSYAWWLNYSGKVSVFSRNGDTWSAPTTLYAGDDEPKSTGGDTYGDRFGFRVSLDGNTLAVGAPLKDDFGDQSGSAYIFEMNDYGQWGQQTKLLPTTADGDVNDQFGNSVAIAGDMAIVGSHHVSDIGAAYVYTRSGATWATAAKLTPSDGHFADQFGWSVAFSGDTALVGALSGSAYLFSFTSGTWTQVAKLTPSDGAENDWFGISVALLGDTALVGAPLDDDNGSNSGSAYVFVKPPGGWVTTSAYTAKLAASDGTADDLFGYSVALSIESALVGAPGGSGSAYLFVKPNDGWAATSAFDAKLTASDGEAGDEFGSSVALSDDTALIGARQDNDNGANSGSAYVYTKPLGGWATTSMSDAKFTASDGFADDYFGWSVALSGDTGLVGAWGDDDNGSSSGSAYVFVKSRGGWVDTTESAKLTASDSATDDRFGWSVAISGDTALVGAELDDDDGERSGSAYFYTFPCGFNQPLDVDKWYMLALPCSPVAPGTVTSQFGDDLDIGDYPDRWALFEHDALNAVPDNGYWRYRQLALGSEVDQGVGYWVLSMDPGTLDIEGVATPMLGGPNCPSDNGCFVVELSSPPSDTDPAKPNFVGHPLPYGVELEDLRILVNDTDLYGPDDPEFTTYVSTTFYWWNGSSYYSFDGETPGMEGRLESMKGVWIKVQNDAWDDNVKLVIPAKPAIETSQLDEDLPWYVSVLDWLIPSAQAAPGHDKAPLEWYVRLIVEQPTTGMVDSNSVFGQLADSVAGYDRHDLPERPPFARPWLTVLFPHPEWGLEDVEFASDYHGLPAKKQDGDSWTFEVRSDDPGRVLKMRWQGLQEILERSLLVDLETNTEIEGNIGYYEFDMNGSSRAFQWILAPESGASKAKGKKK